MTTEEIHKLFPPSYSGNAQISDLRIALANIDQVIEVDSIIYNEVQTLADRDNLTATQGDICKVLDYDGEGNIGVYIYNNNKWVDFLTGPFGGGELIWSSGTKNGGYRFKREDDLFHGAVGNYAVDLVHGYIEVDVGGSGSGSSSGKGKGKDDNSIPQKAQFGATGDYSFAAGYNTTASGYSSIAIGDNSAANGDHSVVLGRDNIVMANESSAFGSEIAIKGGKTYSIGFHNNIDGIETFALGTRLQVYKDNVFVCGFDNDSLEDEDRFCVGIGGEGGANKNGLVIKNNGIVTAPSCTITGINASSLKTLVTKEYIKQFMVERTVEAFDGDGTATDFNLQNGYYPGNESWVDVYVNGVLQEEGSSRDYTLERGSLLKFTSAPPDGSRIIVKILQNLADIA